MAVTQRLQPTLKTGIALTPQVQQTIALIQKNKTELLELVRQELDANPALEEKADADPDTQTAEIVAAEKREDSATGTVEDRSQDDWDPDDWERYREYLQGSSGVRGVVEIGRAVPIDNMVANPETLAGHLKGQVGVRLDSESAIRICEAIIGNLNEAGYLEASLEEIQQLGDGDWSIVDVKRALANVQELDPCGIGARDKRECLLLQLARTSSETCLAEIVVRDHYEAWELNRFEGLAKHLDVTDDELREAIASINRLDLEPGLSVVPYKPEYLLPDVNVIREDNSYQVEFVDEGMPRVRVNPDFMPVSENSTDENFRRENLENAKNLLKAIDQRKVTILKVARSIVQHQKQFMDRGVTALRPLVLQDVADAIGMHESTVSRVVHNKAIDTPHGAFAMKFFFPTKIPCRTGEDVSSVVVKLKIGKIIQNEDRKHPLSDSKIHSRLQAYGYELARRTVAKYREDLRFPIASKRRELGP